MKSASAATQAILASGQYLKAELYTLSLAVGTTHRFTSADHALVVGGNTYQTGLQIRRGPVRQKIGLEVQSLELELTPQPDHPAGEVLIGGVTIMRAVASGLFYAARVTMSKVFLSSWADTSPGAVSWFQGRVNRVEAGRFAAKFTVNSDLELLNVAMPRNILQAGCLHSLFDAGCALTKASFQVSGTTSGSPTVLAFNTSLTQANAYFDLGQITFTSGPNAGLTRVVKRYLNASGAVTLIQPLPSAPGAGDAFTITPGCDKQQSTCSSKFSNLARFRGFPYVPVPETLYDGGASAPPAPAWGGQWGPIAGSDFSGAAGWGYIP